MTLVLITRPQPEADATAAALRRRGYEPLVAPILRMQTLPVTLDDGVAIGAIMVTSASAIRALDSAVLSELRSRPLYAVGERTAAIAREAGFEDVSCAGGDVAALQGLIAARHDVAAPLLYLAGADLAHDLAGDLGALGFTVATRTTYRMIAAERLEEPAIEALRGRRVAAALHYSRRSARAVFQAAAADALLPEFGAVLHGCLSEPIAAAIRDYRAPRIAIAAAPAEPELLAALDRAIRSGSG
jgi:uroporphyrinogen-III synthase